jgi:long-chain acyl-CoA synthetase
VVCLADSAQVDITPAPAKSSRIVSKKIALGLIGLHVQPGERVGILANTRPEWSYADIAVTDIGAIPVPIYQTNSPEECAWVISDSGASVIFCEDERQLAKIVEIHEQVPDLRTAIVIEPPTDDSQLSPLPFQTLTLEQLKSAGDSRDLPQLELRREHVDPEDTYTIIYTSGTTGLPKGCILTHGNYRAILGMIEERGSLRAEDDAVVYLYLPLAHSFALLLQLVVFDLGLTLAYSGGDTKQVIVELSEVKPTYLPSVPRIFEKIYTFVSANIDVATLESATKVGIAVRDLEAEGKQIPAELQKPFEEAEEKLFKNVRAAFGGRLREAVSGAAPISKEILEFFYACGVPVWPDPCGSVRPL